jgi:hypothetical protein
MELSEPRPRDEITVGCFQHTSSLVAQCPLSRISPTPRYPSITAHSLHRQHSVFVPRYLLSIPFGLSVLNLDDRSIDVYFNLALLFLQLTFLSTLRWALRGSFRELDVRKYEGPECSFVPHVL